MRLVIGAPNSLVTKPMIFALASQIYDAAQSAGFTHLSFDHSRVKSSSSRYVKMRGPHGHIWIVRVSNHRRPLKSPHALPHFDLVSLDGCSGIPETADWLRRAYAGQIAWEDTSAYACHRRKAKKIRKPRR